MELIERYIEEIGTYLPKDLREDVSTELRSNLEESIESRLAEDPELSRKHIEIELLKELGPPHEVADSYVPRPRVLFGPRLYPGFLRTMKIANAVLVALAALGIAVDFSNSMSPLTLGRSLISAFSSILTGSLLILGIAVVVFAVIERTAVLPPVTRDDWDPGTLPEVEDPDKVSIGDRVASIAFLVVALVVLNFLQDWIGARVTMNDESGWVPFLGPAFQVQLWLLNVCLVLDLLVNFLVLLRWRWTTPLRWAGFAVNCPLLDLARPHRLRPFHLLSRSRMDGRQRLVT